jgi:hypothetical protein
MPTPTPIPSHHNRHSLPNVPKTIGFF